MTAGVKQRCGGRRKELGLMLGLKRIDRILNARVRELCGVKKWWAKGLMKVSFFGGLVTLKEWRTIY